jgi:hypothetical protein
MKPTDFLLGLLFSFIFVSCAEEETVLTAEEFIPEAGFLVDHDEDGHVDRPDYEFGDAIQQHVEGQQVDPYHVEKVQTTRPDGTTETLYLLEGDIELTKDQLQEFQNMDAALQKQYRTSNLVSDNNISVIGYTGGSYALTSKMRTALQWAINNYNRINTNKRFTLSFQASTNADIVVYRNFQNTGAGGSAGFPSGGAPYKWVQIYAGMQNYDTNVNEHVMTHEIGHAMGLRHTDYFSRQSCGQNTNEGSAGVGAIHIPGTPTGYDANSVMLACFSAGEDGEFGFYDIVALEYLY